MLKKIVHKIINVIDRHYPISDQQREVCTYGLDLLLYTIISTIGLILIGLSFRMPIGAIIIVAIFYLNQSTGGGFHANTHLACFLTMAMGLSAALLLLRFNFSLSSYSIVGAVSCLALFLVPLVLHPNKKYLAKHSERFIRRSRIVTSIEFLMILLCITILSFPFTSAVCVGIFVSAISRLSAYLLQKHSD